MIKSPLQMKDLKLKHLPKGTFIICFQCGKHTYTGVEMYLAQDEVLFCPQCSEGCRHV